MGWLPEDEHAPEAVARAAAAKDPQLAELLLAECARLRDDNEPNRIVEAELLAAAKPRAPRYRPQFQLITSGLFDDNVSALGDGAHGYAWVYDDDLASLDTGAAARRDPWSRNVAAVRSIHRATARWVTSIRLCLFEGTSRIVEALREHDALGRVSHLDLRTQSEERSLPVARLFPRLRGMGCTRRDVADLLAEDAAELRALDVWLEGSWLSSAVDLAMKAPRLGHLGLRGGAPTAEDLRQLARHPILDRITSLDLSATNDAFSFPFETLVELRGAFEYLSRIYLPGHLVPAATFARVAEALPGATLVAFDRRETMALDFETTGWGASAR